MELRDEAPRPSSADRFFRGLCQRGQEVLVLSCRQCERCDHRRHAGNDPNGRRRRYRRAFVWMCGRSGNCDFLVIRATGTDAYNPRIQSLCPNENSVATLIIPNLAAANDPAVASIIRHAEAIWITGGDRSPRPAGLKSGALLRNKTISGSAPIESSRSSPLHSGRSQRLTLQEKKVRQKSRSA